MNTTGKIYYKGNRTLMIKKNGPTCIKIYRSNNDMRDCLNDILIYLKFKLFYFLKEFVFL